MEIQLSDRVENIVGKGEIAYYEQFLLSHNVFKSCQFLMRQNEYLWSNGLNCCLQNILIFDESTFLSFGRVKSFIAKGENAGKKHFLYFPQCFDIVFLTLSQTSPLYIFKSCISQLC